MVCCSSIFICFKIFDFTWNIFDFIIGLFVVHECVVLFPHIYKFSRLLPVIEFYFHTIVVGKYTWYNSIFINFPRLVLWLNICSILEKIPCALEMNLYSIAVRWNVLYMSLGFISSTVYFRSNVSLLIFCLVVYLLLKVRCLSPLHYSIVCYSFSSICVCSDGVCRYIWFYNLLTPLSLYNAFVSGHSFLLKAYFIWYMYG